MATSRPGFYLLDSLRLCNPGRAADDHVRSELGQLMATSLVDSIPPDTATGRLRMYHASRNGVSDSGMEERGLTLACLNGQTVGEWAPCASFGHRSCEVQARTLSVPSAPLHGGSVHLNRANIHVTAGAVAAPRNQIDKPYLIDFAEVRRVSPIRRFAQRSVATHGQHPIDVKFHPPQAGKREFTFQKCGSGGISMIANQEGSIHQLNERPNRVETGRPSSPADFRQTGQVHIDVLVAQSCGKRRRTHPGPDVDRTGRA